MLMAVKNNFRFLFYNLKCNISSALEYKKNFIIEAIFMFISNGFYLIFWNVIFNANDGQLNGIEMKDVLYLWAIPSMSWGIANFFFAGVREINKYILTGKLDSFMLQPKNAFLNIATSKCNFASFGDLLYGTVIAIIISNSFLDIIQIVSFAIIGAIFTVSTSCIIRMLSIWLGDIEEIASIYEFNLLINFSTYPEKIFGNFVKFLLYTAIPAAYIVHLPIKFINNFDIKILLYILLALIIYIIITAIIFKRGLKKYESGNSMTLK